MQTHQSIQKPGHGLAKWGSILYIGENALFIGAFVLWLEFGDFSPGGVVSGSSEDRFMGFLASSLMVLTAVQHGSLLMILWALFSRKYRARWFYYATQVSSVFMLVSAGGPILAIVVSRYLHQNRAEFFGGLSTTPPPLPVSHENTAPADSASLPPTAETPDVAAVLEENRRLKALVADQALQLQERNSR